MGYLKKAANTHEVTTLVSLHQVNIAAHFGERFLGLRNGELVFDVGRDELSPDMVDDLYGSVDTVALAEHGDDNDDGEAPVEGDDGDTEQRVDA